MNHDTFDKLVATLLLDEKHGLLLQQNHDERRLPSNPSSKPKPEATQESSKCKAFRMKEGMEATAKPWKMAQQLEAPFQGKKSKLH
jgi:hypothetical protein